MKLSEIKLSYNRVVLSNHALTSASYINNFLRDYLANIGEDITLQEKFFAIFFDIGMNVIGILKVAESGIDSVLIDPRLIYTTAVTTGAKNIVIAHNHPSGTMRPSSPDQEITKRIRAGAETLDVTLLDHLILSGANDYEYFSFAESGLI